MGSHDLLRALAVVLGVAAVTSFISHRLRQPVVLGYIIAGLVVGPHVPVPVVADPVLIRTLSELGVILLMFSLGLEFSIRKLFRAGASTAITAIVECSLLLWLGFSVARLFGWSTYESIFTAGMVAISSTTIIAKTFDEQNVTGTLRELVVGILIVEDLIAILLMATFTAVASGAGLSAASLARTGARLGFFLGALVVVGMLVVPRAMRAVAALRRPEATAVASVGLCFGVALLARELGYSVALGAFIAGSLVAESGEEKTIEPLVKPVRDVFGAVFFVSVGMSFDPAVVVEYWAPIAALTLVVIGGKVIGVTAGAFITGNGVHTSVRTGMSLAQIGEFSFIIAGLGLSLKAAGSFLYPIAIAVSALTTLLTPWFVRASGPSAAWVDRVLPRPLQTFGALYGSWLERIRTKDAAPDGRSARRLVRLLAFDASAIILIVVTNALGRASFRAFLEERGLSVDIARALVVVVTIAVALPFFVGIVRVSRRLGAVLADMALPPSDVANFDLAAAPRRALVVTIQLACVLLVGTPFVAVTQPFLRGFIAAELLLVVLVLLGFAFWRTATNLQGHVRAGAEVVVEALARQASSTEPGHVSLDAIFVGLGEPKSIRIPAGSIAAGKSLAELNLRGLTGATVLAITRGPTSILVPSARDQLQEGDVLAIAGTRGSIEAAKAVLESHP